MASENAPRFEPRRHWCRWAVWDHQRQCYAYQGRTWLRRLTAGLYADELNMLHCAEQRQSELARD